ncbi:hypothetical protein FA95DRAFT_1502712 [Auriscalpium vulgare]|uniref:Uncharacterized protein n=1 Tax=Auriscalpium vulgare TaxID=40419 RepID=A0ACB8R952_9AGAM|nr:hypothetical protein FA95DRAFT_1502712 [Auriscalpium vulgare]
MIRNKKRLVSDASTLRRHLGAMHKGAHDEWASKADWLSKLPADVKARKEHQKQATQSRLDPHLQEKPVTERVVPYSDKLFRNAAIQWLIETNQPIQAFDHPSFKNMINVAARATNGVVIPGRKATRAEIIDMFKTQMTALRNRLLVRGFIPSESMQCRTLTRCLATE